MGSSAASRNWATNSPNSASAPFTLIESVTSSATAKSDCAAVSRSSSRWSTSIGSPWNEPAAKANTIGSVPTSSDHWLTFDDTRVARASVVLSRHA